MKKILLPLASAVLTLMAMNAHATNGTVKFTGSIVKSTCTVNSSDTNKEVFIGKYPTNAFSKIGDVTASKAFTINLSNCDSGTYTLRFDGPTVAGNPNLLAVSAATGVGIEILDNNEKVLPINQTADDNTAWVTASSTNTAAPNGTAAFNLKARYKSFNQTVTPGEANASTSFTIEYK
ncbi:type 1 fimbrial protein [Pantoea sp. Acro-805]|uniref:Type 1 fimbrial protein n=1 Tax=Candidatus Pantoea formicae TaxID=2608355 RepID=A0ABX0QWV4_9GAMM|nr:fimbrial protein [Pantoea formicae]MDF7651473.1 fimbrial protein [Erwiniaceae bacterium L1_54_3]NIF00781.1 type 1 fimbrial protein [Pantoea formicae]